MIELGYALSSEEHPADELVRQARLAEEAGFRHALISDHYHPWIDRQGESPFVWSVIGAISQVTEHLEIGTGVTCPTTRIHPAIVAQAAATAASLLPGRFMLGVGTGENLNEHILGDRWPSADERLEQLEEAVDVIRELWQGELVSYRGRHFTVDRARIYSLPDELPPIAVAAGAHGAAEVAGRIGDALISTTPEREVVQTFADSGGAGKPRYGQLTVCWAASTDEAIQIAHRHWPNAALRGDLSQELALPRHFRQAAELVTPSLIADAITCGPDPERFRDALATFEQAGFTRVYLHQVGDDPDGFMRFFERELLPELAAIT
ncbi:MAG TPA: TIGR03557 family F420-dependent LLM class oxidoreductase [Gaiellaceae bacterium]|nr:TIGR03557 family F420-dependent LLM class oxidoreductase [Gaiellaceae bacterium]